MDTKWKTVLVPVDFYGQIKAVAWREGRTLFGQLKDEHEFWSEPIPPPTAANDNSEILEADKK